MKYITKEEFEKEAWRGKGGSSKVYREIAGMEVGTILVIEPEDWQRKYAPGAIARYIAKKYGRKYIVLSRASKKGWSVTRVK